MHDTVMLQNRQSQVTFSAMDNYYLPLLVNVLAVWGTKSGEVHGTGCKRSINQLWTRPALPSSVQGILHFPVVLQGFSMAMWTVRGKASILVYGQISHKTGIELCSYELNRM